jgi:hypothetical protein
MLRDPRDVNLVTKLLDRNDCTFASRSERTT